MSLFAVIVARLSIVMACSFYMSYVLAKRIELSVGMSANASWIFFTDGSSQCAQKKAALYGIKTAFFCAFKGNTYNEGARKILSLG